MLAPLKHQQVLHEHTCHPAARHVILLPLYAWLGPIIGRCLLQAQTYSRWFQSIHCGNMGAFTHLDDWTTTHSLLNHTQTYDENSQLGSTHICNCRLHIHVLVLHTNWVYTKGLSWKNAVKNPDVVWGYVVDRPLLWFIYTGIDSRSQLSPTTCAVVCHNPSPTCIHLIMLPCTGQWPC